MRKGSTQIDATIETDGTLQATRGSKTTDFQDVINTDHRDFVICLDAKERF